MRATRIAGVLAGLILAATITGCTTYQPNPVGAARTEQVGPSAFAVGPPTPLTDTPAPADSTAASTGVSDDGLAPTYSQPATAAWFTRTASTATFLQWTNTAGQLNGTQQTATLDPATGRVDSTTQQITGRITGSDDILLNVGITADTVIGNITDQQLSLAGAGHTLLLHPGSAADYAAALADLHAAGYAASAASSQASQAEVSAAASRAAAEASAAQSAAQQSTRNSAADDAAAALTQAIATTRHDIGTADSDLTGIAEYAQAEKSSSTDLDAGLAAENAALAAGRKGDPAVCSQFAALDADVAALEAEKTGVQQAIAAGAGQNLPGDINAIHAAVLQLKTAQRTNPGYTPPGAPAAADQNNEIDDAVRELAKWSQQAEDATASAAQALSTAQTNVTAAKTAAAC